jgi:Raf kinase inhibitor-like YbhB/YbcL family protein
MIKSLLSLSLVSIFGATAAAAPFTLTSKDFKDGGNMPDKQEFNSFGCKGSNVSPDLEWTAPPAGTKSLALMVRDPDAPTGSGWWHWVVYNIPADTTSLPEGGPLPKTAVQGNTDFGVPGWGGPCPPVGSGVHHYEFTLFALKVDKLDLPATATAAFVGFNVIGNAIGKTKLTGLYNRAK